MRGASLRVGLLVGLVAAVASAQPAATTSEVAGDEGAAHSKVLPPLHVDLKGTLDTDILLVYVELGVSADLGLLPVGPGTLGVGASFDYGFCGSFCWAMSSLLNVNYGQSFASPMVRLRYDLPLPATRASPTTKLNAYALVLGGLVVASMGLSNKDGTVKVEGKDTSFAIGIGGGVQYFFTDRFFGGAEMQLRYAKGRYDWKATVGQYTIQDKEDTWSLTGLGIRLNVGVRFP